MKAARRPKVINFAFAANRTCLLRHGAMVSDLEFERRETLVVGQARRDSQAHHRVEQCRCVTAVYGAHRIVDRRRRRAFEDDETFLGRDAAQPKRMDNAFVVRCGPR